MYGYILTYGPRKAVADWVLFLDGICSFAFLIVGCRWRRALARFRWYLYRRETLRLFQHLLLHYKRAIQGASQDLLFLRGIATAQRTVGKANWLTIWTCVGWYWALHCGGHWSGSGNGEAFCARQRVPPLSVAKHLARRLLSAWLGICGRMPAGTLYWHLPGIDGMVRWRSACFQEIRSTATWFHINHGRCLFLYKLETFFLQERETNSSQQWSEMKWNEMKFIKGCAPSQSNYYLAEAIWC